MSSELKIYKVSPAEKKLVRYYPGGVRAGIPVDSPDDREVLASLQDFVYSDPETSLIVSVMGDSMIERGIAPGDTIIIRTDKSLRTLMGFV